eukprot:GHVS01105229.1.p1 GENE.GHVS01105229.1~~GHVS01105229.1.p1  ORF type:complete len:346 (-),score=44.71 GHVS01105229.1:147-1184(-)
MFLLYFMYGSIITSLVHKQHITSTSAKYVQSSSHHIILASSCPLISYLLPATTLTKTTVNPFSRPHRLFRRPPLATFHPPSSSRICLSLERQNHFLAPMAKSSDDTSNNIAPLPCSPNNNTTDSSHKQQPTLPRWSSIEEIGGKGQWMHLQKIHYVDAHNTKRSWERYQRTTAHPSGEHADSACAVAVLTQGGVGKHLLAIKQYRPSMDKFTIEFPAGLIDEGEDAGQTAVRELQEETGYCGDVVCVGPVLAQSVLGTESTQLVVMKVDLDKPENSNPKQSDLDAADIEIIRLPMDNLMPSFLALQNERTVLYEGIHNFLAGLALNSQTLLLGAPPVLGTNNTKT